LPYEKLNAKPQGGKGAKRNTIEPQRFMAILPNLIGGFGEIDGISADASAGFATI